MIHKCTKCKRMRNIRPSRAKQYCYVCSVCDNQRASSRIIHSRAMKKYNQKPEVKEAHNWKEKARILAIKIRESQI